MQTFFDTSPGDGAMLRSRPLWHSFLPGVILVAAILFDHGATLHSSIISVACVLSLVIFSFILPSRLMIGWTFAYILAVAVSLWMSRGMWSGHTSDTEVLVVTQTCAAAEATLFACLVTFYFKRGDWAARQINQQLDRLEIPAITSDGDGWLLHANHKATELFGGETTFAVPFFEHFALPTEKGSHIKRYLDLATGMTGGPMVVDLALGSDRSQPFLATMLSVNVGRRRWIITLLNPDPRGRMMIH